jgi:tRNA threonylcarbamoyladenosine biosynthesis protein TsaE
VAATEALAMRLAEELQPGDCIALEGDLGAGKTQFVRGLVRGLGGDGHAVSSPTFVLMNVYETPRLRVYHLDAYRTHGSDDLEAIGFSELLDQGGIVVIEWPSRITALLPARRIVVNLETLSPRRRRITINRT